MQICLVGGTGVLGLHLVPRLVEQGHHVRVVVRPGKETQRIERLGAEPVGGDILDAQGLRAAVAGCDAAIHAATAIPKKGAPVDWTLNDQIRREGTANLIAACEAEGVKDYVQQSIAHLVADGSGNILDETAALKSTVVTRSSADMENLVQASKLHWVILRGGIFYGPGAGQEITWRAMARDGLLRIPGDGSDYISLVHVADYAAAIAHVLEAPLEQGIYNVVDDQPARYGDLFRHIAAMESAVSPAEQGPKIWASCRISNQKIRDQTAWRPRYKTYRSGWL